LAKSGIKKKKPLEKQEVTSQGCTRSGTVNYCFS